MDKINFGDIITIKIDGKTEEHEVLYSHLIGGLCIRRNLGYFEAWIALDKVEIIKVENKE